MAKKKTKEIILDDFHYHEALDRTFMLTQILDDFVSSHPVIKKYTKVERLVDRAGSSLAEAYQLLGKLRFDEKLRKTKREAD